jgi:hypothetical protein
MLRQHHLNDQHVFSSSDERVVESTISRTFGNSHQVTEGIHHGALVAHMAYLNEDDEMHEVVNSSMYILTNGFDFPKHDLHWGAHFLHEAARDVGCS